MKELVKFIMEKTELNLDNSFYSSLSVDNKSYVDKNFKCINPRAGMNITEEDKDDEISKIISSLESSGKTEKKVEEYSEEKFDENKVSSITSNASKASKENSKNKERRIGSGGNNTLEDEYVIY